MPKLVQKAAASEHVTEATVIATCNRVEIYAEVDRFHGSVEELSMLLVERAGGTTEAMLPHLYVHYDDGAVSHLFQVAAGLDSMAVGEGQILGQTRDALRLGQELGTVGPALNVLFQQALRVGKRSRAETDIDRVAPTLVGAALDQVLDQRGGRTAGPRRRRRRHGRPRDRHRVPARRRVGHRRQPDAGPRPAARHGVRRDAGHPRRPARRARRGRPGDRLRRRLRRPGHPGDGRGGPRRRPPDGVHRPGAARTTSTRRSTDLPGVTRLDLGDLADELHASPAGREVDEVRRIVTQEVSAFLAARRQASVTPTVVALRSMATTVVDAEMSRLAGRLPDLDDATRAEVLQAVRRVADKLLHEPTVRVRELANEEGAVSYAAALAELFALDPDAVDAVTRPEGLAT